MAITTLAGVSTGLIPPQPYAKANVVTVASGFPTSSWFYGGSPASGVVDTTTSGGLARSSSSALVTGQIPFYDPTSGNTYLARMTFVAPQTTFGSPSWASTAWLCDRLWECGHDDTANAAFSPTSTSLQTITTSATWPARDENGATAGVGVYIALEVSTNLGVGTPTYTLTYTNSNGTGSRTGTNIFASVTSMQKGGFYNFGLAVGDIGVKSVQSIQASSTQTSGQWVLVAYRLLCALDTFYTGSCTNAVDALTSGFPQMRNGTVPFIVFSSNIATYAVQGMLHYTQG